MCAVRWLLFLPAAVIAGVVGSVAGGVVASPLGQTAADTGSAFVGPFAFIFTAGFVAPAARQKIGLGAAVLVGLLAIGTFVLSTFTSIEEFAALPQHAKILTPVAQVLAALFSVFVLPPFVVAGSTLEHLWRELLGLGVAVALFGAALVTVGVITGLTDHGWFVLKIGGGVLLLGALTWKFPFAHATLRVSKLQK